MATYKQIKAVKNLGVNGGSFRLAMLKAGYSEKMANNPKRLTESKGFKELVEEYIPDWFLMQRMNALNRAI